MGGGGEGGPNSQHAHDVVTTSMRRNDVTYQCEIITFLILKSDIIEKSRIELRGIVLPVPSNQLKDTFIIIFALQLGSFVFFSCFTQKVKEKVGGLLGRAKGHVAHPRSNYWWRPLFLRLCNYALNLKKIS